MSEYLALHGSYYIDNFGDTLFIVFFRKWILDNSQYLEDEIILPFANVRVRNLIKVSEKKGFSGLFKAKKIVFVGGGYLGERPKRKFSWNIRFILRHLSVGYFALFFRKEFIFVGVGAGPLTNPISKVLTTFLCNKSFKVIVRDQESKEYLETYGVRRNKITATADSILSMEKSDVDNLWNEKYERMFSEYRYSKISMVGLHIQDISNNSLNVENLIEDIKDYFINNDYFKVIAFNDTYKESYIFPLIDLLPDWITNKIIFVNYESPNQLIGLINNLDVVITTKLHCGIIANCLGKYTLSTSVHSKTTRLYSQLNLLERERPLHLYKRGDLVKMMANYECGKEYKNVNDEIRSQAQMNKIELLAFLSK